NVIQSDFWHAKILISKLVLADMAIVEEGVGVGTVKSGFVHVIGACDDNGTLTPQLLHHLSSCSLQILTVQAPQSRCKAQGIGQRAYQIHNSRNAKCLAGWSNKTHGWVHGLGKDKGKSHFLQGLG